MIKRNLLAILFATSFTFASLAVAQEGSGIRHDQVQLEDLKAIVGMFHAFAVPVPEGTRAISLASPQRNGNLSTWNLTYSDTSPAPEQLRIVIGFPRFSSPTCGEGLINVVLTLKEGSEDAGSWSFCHQLPETSGGHMTHVIREGKTVELNAWTPLFAHVPYIRDHPDAEPSHAGAYDSDEALLILLYTGTERGDIHLPQPDLPALRQELNLP